MRGGATPAAIAPSPRMLGGGSTSRMTPRVPNAGEVSSRLQATPRAPKNGQGGSSTQPQSYRGAQASGRPRYATAGKAYTISPAEMGVLERDKMLYLAKKLVHLSILLEQDTVTEDFKYPGFHGSPGGYS